VLSTDQRGTDFPRIYDGNADGTAAVDIGAFEAFYPMASISSFVPNNWGTGRGAFELVINGTNFVAGSQVKWNGQNRVTTFRFQHANKSADFSGRYGVSRTVSGYGR
jgi:hypothetical protein